VQTGNAAIKRLAGVTGLGCICAAGARLDAILPAMYAGKRNPAAPIRIQADVAGQPPVFEVPSICNKIEGPSSRTIRLCLAAVEEALEEAELTADGLRGVRLGIALGTTVGCALNDEPFYRDFKSGKNPGIVSIANYLNSNPAIYLAGLFEARGPVSTVANACSSGTDAIGMAKSWIEQGLCDIAIAGGCDELSRIAYLGFCALQVSSSFPCKPFDRTRSGLNLGEGAGVMVLESPDSANHRNKRPLAYLTGYGSACDAYHPITPHPEGIGLRRAIAVALEGAALPAGQVAFINAHGTSTIENDRVEGRVIASMFPHSTHVVSTKAYTGHTLGAAGGMEAVFTVRALLDRQLPATAGFQEADPECIVVPTRKNEPVTGNAGISTSLAFGGNNSALIFETEKP
jgi:3-oxoacyl-[acyl-carrier-protein] synthase-1/3-oxoacyl-[acyl-carrier-protein] synthase II